MSLKDTQQDYIKALKQEHAAKEKEEEAHQALKKAEKKYQQRIAALLEQDEELASAHASKASAQTLLDDAKLHTSKVRKHLKQVDERARSDLSLNNFGDNLPEGFSLQRRKAITIHNGPGFIQAAIKHNHSLLQINEETVQDWLKLCTENKAGDDLFLPEYFHPFKEFVKVGFEPQPTISKATLSKLELEEPTVSPTGDKTDTVTDGVGEESTEKTEEEDKLPF